MSVNLTQKLIESVHSYTTPLTASPCQFSTRNAAYAASLVKDRQALVAPLLFLLCTN